MKMHIDCDGTSAIFDSNGREIRPGNIGDFCTLMERSGVIVERGATVGLAAPSPRPTTSTPTSITLSPAPASPTPPPPPEPEWRVKGFASEKAYRLYKFNLAKGNIRVFTRGDNE